MSALPGTDKDETSMSGAYRFESGSEFKPHRHQPQGQNLFSYQRPQTRLNYGLRITAQ